MTSNSSSFTHGYFIALTATVLWSFTGILISYLSKTYQLPSLVLAFWRDLFVSFGMLAGLLALLTTSVRTWRLVTYLITACFSAAWRQCAPT